MFPPDSGNRSTQGIPAMQLRFGLLDQQTVYAPEIQEAVEALALESSAEGRGAIYTRREVVEFILDLAGYTVGQPLYTRRLLEPSFGGGDFLLPVVTRLLQAWQAATERDDNIVEVLGGAVRAVELHRQTYDETRQALLTHLASHGVEPDDATALVQRWLVQDDFLLVPLVGEFDLVVGNPPYVRQERIPEPLLAEYRRRYGTLYDRADLYVPFIERSLALLRQGGAVAFICADRWMKNRFGGPLRSLITERFHLETYVDMVGTDAFQDQVTAYPAVVVLRRAEPGVTRVARRPPIEPTALSMLAGQLRSQPTTARPSGVELLRLPPGDAPWLLTPAAKRNLLRRLEQRFPPLEEVGCTVGIGVATGADRVLIGEYATLDVEVDRKVPLAMTQDIVSGQVEWRGQGVINPFTRDGDLVDLDHFPRLRRYLEAHRALLAGRHCARKRPDQWYRTIDRIQPDLATTPKLLIPDIKGEAHVVFEPGELYPHHNLYYVISRSWELRALQAVLRSDVARLFVAAYSTRMRGGYLRFQAQYLRRVRLPRWEEVPVALREELTAAAVSRSRVACNRAAARLYGLSDEEQQLLVERDE